MRNIISNRKEKGFTLIELVMVIVILGILAAFALPRFADFGGDARKATIEGAAGAVKSAAAIAHSAWLADGSKPDPLVLDGANVDMSTEGYPAAIAQTADATDNEGITTAAQIDPADFTFTPGTDGTGVFAITGYTASPAATENNGGCQFTYNEKTGRVTDIKTGGC